MPDFSEGRNILSVEDDELGRGENLLYLGSLLAQGLPALDHGGGDVGPRLCLLPALAPLRAYKLVEEDLSGTVCNGEGKHFISGLCVGSGRQAPYGCDGCRCIRFEPFFSPHSSLSS